MACRGWSAGTQSAAAHRPARSHPHRRIYRAGSREPRGRYRHTGLKRTAPMRINLILEGNSCGIMGLLQPMIQGVPTADHTPPEPDHANPVDHHDRDHCGGTRLRQASGSREHPEGPRPRVRSSKRSSLAGWPTPPRPSSNWPRWPTGWAWMSRRTALTAASGTLWVTATADLLRTVLSASHPEGPRAGRRRRSGGHPAAPTVAPASASTTAPPLRCPTCSRAPGAAAFNATDRGTAGLKCGVQIDLLTGALCGLDLVDGRSSDQTLPVRGPSG